jgi:transposase
VCARRAGTTPETLELLGESLGPEAEVVLEATATALPIARLLRPHVARVVFTEPSAVHESGAATTDKIDAGALAKLLASGFAGEVWRPTGDGGAAPVAVAAASAGQAAHAREEPGARGADAQPRAAAADERPVRAKGRAWLAERPLPGSEREMVEGCLRHLDFLNDELAALDRSLARRVLASEEMLLFLQLLGVSAVTVATLMAAIGDISRFPTPRHLVGYLGLHPRVRQSGTGPATHGRISKHGPGAVRAVLVEAAWVASRSAGPCAPLAADRRPPRGEHCHRRGRAQARGVRLAPVDQARGLAFKRPAALAEKARTLELAAGAERRQGRREGARVRVSAERRKLDKQLAEQAERAYRRLPAEWQASAPKAGAGETPGRASSRPSKLDGLRGGPGAGRRRAAPPIGWRC